MKVFVWLVIKEKVLGQEAVGWGEESKQKRASTGK